MLVWWKSLAERQGLYSYWSSTSPALERYFKSKNQHNKNWGVYFQVSWTTVPSPNLLSPHMRIGTFFWGDGFHWKSNAIKRKLLWFQRSWNITESLLWGVSPTAEMQKAKRQLFVSLFFDLDVCLVAVGMVCHPVLDSCEVLTTIKKKLIMVKINCLLIYFVNELCDKVMWAVPQESERRNAWNDQIIKQQKQRSRESVEYSIWTTYEGCSSSGTNPGVYLLAQGPKGGNLLPVGCCHPAGSHTAPQHSTDAMLLTDRWPGAVTAV